VAASFPLGQAGYVAVDTGDRIVGLRSNDAEVVALLRGILAPMVVEGVDVYPNVSLRVGHVRGTTRPRHLLWRRREVVLRTGSLGHLVRAALGALESLLPVPDGLLALQGGFVVGHGGAVVLHPRAVRLPSRQLARWGWGDGGGRPPLLDPERGELIVPGTRLVTDLEAVADLDRRFPPSENEVPLPAGRHRLRAILLHGAAPAQGDPPAPDPRLEATTALRPLDRRRTVADVAAIARAVRGCEVVVVSGPSPADLGRSLRELAGALGPVAAQP
jgi:hypothetical protein